MRAAWAPGPGPEPEPGSFLSSDGGSGSGGDDKSPSREPPWRDGECIRLRAAAGVDPQSAGFGGGGEPLQKVVMARAEGGRQEQQRQSRVWCDV